MIKLAINLLQPELFPKRPLLSLTRVIVFWLALLLLMVFWSVYSLLNADKLALQYQQISEQQAQQQTQLDDLQQRVSSNRANSKLIERLDTLKIVLANKKELHRQLTDQSQTYAAGFSAAMTELAELHHKDVSLEQVIMVQGELTFTGLAKKPDAVPLWLAAFESSTFLSGKHFTHFSLSQNEQGFTSFTVSSATAKTQKRPN